MGTADRNWSARAGVGVVVLLAAFAACGPDVSPTEPGSPPAEAKVARASLPDPSADLGIWLEQSKPTKQWPNQHTGDCIVTDMWPKLGTAQLGGTPTSLQWTIYDLCPDEQLMRIDYKGPNSPFAACNVPEVQNHQPFKISYSGKNPAVVVTCTLVPNPCTVFYVDVNTFPDRTASRFNDCPTTSGQIEIEPW